MNKDEIRRRVDAQVGLRVAEHRKGKFSQEQLAAETHGVLSRSALANIERGRQRVAVYQLFAIAKALGIECAELLPSGKAIFMSSSGRTETELKVVRKLMGGGPK